MVVLHNHPCLVVTIPQHTQHLSKCLKSVVAMNALRSSLKLIRFINNDGSVNAIVGNNSKVPRYQTMVIRQRRTEWKHQRDLIMTQRNLVKDTEIPFIPA